MQEKKFYFSRKHKLYGQKVEVSIRPNGLGSVFSRHYLASVIGINIMSRRMKKNHEKLQNKEYEEEFENDYLLHQKVS